MNLRYEQLRSILQAEKCFKMICGAGNENKLQVKKLAFVYTLAGATILDVSANVDVIKSAVEGIVLAYKLAPELGVTIKSRPYIMASVGMPGDHHVRKSYIDPNKCIGCNLCIPVCPTKAIPENFVDILELYKTFNGSLEVEDQSKEIVIKDLCIGCGKCSNICPKTDIISYRHNSTALEELLPKCLEAGAELFELHAGVGEDDITLKEWRIINKINSQNYNSICLDRLNLGNLKLEHRIAEVQKISKERLIVQTDGLPMSGGENDFNTTLQAIACADVVNKRFNMRVNKKKEIDSLGNEKISSKRLYNDMDDDSKVIPILVSGGTNQLTRELAIKTNVRINGVAVGTYARDIIQQYISDVDFFDNVSNISKAVDEAKILVNISNKKD